MSSDCTHPRLPHHVAIIMDGNGRWAEKRHLPRAAGHKSGVRALRKVVENCLDTGIGHLTVYAFSSENWRRPEKEVSFLMDLFMTSLNEEVRELHANQVRLKFIGERRAFPEKLQGAMNDAETLTVANARLGLNIAANYGGRWDISQASRQLALQVLEGRLQPDEIDEARVAQFTSLATLPEPDLFIRTGGESRVSNFLLWQLAYTELYFTDVLWPDFDTAEMDRALAWYAERQRRFGQTSEQVENA